jgi:hypothetical protein
VTPFRVWAERALVGGLAPIVVYGSRFASNIILSRLLAPDEFGTAVAISVVLGLGGLATDVALDRFVIILLRRNREAGRFSEGYCSGAYTLNISTGKFCPSGCRTGHFRWAMAVGCDRSESYHWRRTQHYCGKRGSDCR